MPVRRKPPHCIVSSSTLELLVGFDCSALKLIQSDGAFLFKNDHIAGSAGLVVWGAYLGKPAQALHFVALPLHPATDSMHAEALGLKAAANLVAESVVALQAVLKRQIEVVFQMDDLPVIHHLIALPSAPT